MVNVHWQSSNDGATYTATAQGEKGRYWCSSAGESCTLRGLPCGALFSVTAVAETQAGRSPPSYSVPLETGTWRPPARALTSLGSLGSVVRRELSYLVYPTCDRNTLNSEVFQRAPKKRIKNKTFNIWTQVLKNITRRLIYSNTDIEGENMLALQKHLFEFIFSHDTIYPNN